MSEIKTFASESVDIDPGQIVVELADNLDTSTWESNEVTYNLTRFINDYMNNSDNWRQKIDKFTYAIDTKFKIDKDDQRFAKLIQDMELIFEAYCQLLPKFDARFTKVKTYKTGSLYAGLKVAFPLEADFMLELNDECNMRTEEFYDIVMQVYNSPEIKDYIPQNWIIHGVLQHGAGVCLVMEYKPNTTSDNGVGASMDLVPICKVPQTDENKIELTEKASSVIDYYNLTDLCESEIYRLCCREVSDTGLIENRLLKCLDDDMKMGFRVAKFLLQFCFIHGDHQEPDDDIQLCPNIAFEEVVDKRKAIHLYGYKPCVSSFFLRVCLFQVVFNTHLRDVSKLLKGGALTLCLLDMVKSFVTEDVNTYTNIYDVIQEDGVHTKQLWISKESIESIIEKYTKDAIAGDMSSYKSVNSESAAFSFVNDQLDDAL